MKAIAQNTLTAVATAGGTTLAAAAAVASAAPGVRYYMVRAVNHSTTQAVTVGEPGLVPVALQTGTQLPLASATGAGVSMNLGPYSVEAAGTLAFITGSNTAAVGYTVYALADEMP